MDESESKIVVIRDHRQRTEGKITLWRPLRKREHNKDAGLRN